MKLLRTLLATVLVTAPPVWAQTTPGSRPQDRPQVAPISGRLPIAGGYRAESGDLDVEIIDREIPGGISGKSLPIRCYLPVGVGVSKVPLVVVSPGTGATRTAFSGLASHLASHGVAVVVVTHDDAPERRQRRPEHQRLHQEHLGAVRTSLDPFGRIADLSAVLDAGESLAPVTTTGRTTTSACGPYPSIDVENAVVLGHGDGARAAMIAVGAAMTTDLSDEPVSFRDERFGAAILLSPPGAVRPEFDRTSWRDISSPMLVITGTDDFGSREGDTPASSCHPFEFGPSGNGNMLVIVEGGTHASYLAPGPDAGPRRGSGGSGPHWFTRGVTRSMAGAFIDSQLRGSGLASYYIASDGITRLEGGRVQVIKK
ncbi:MAG: hypothetical protein AAGB51_08885 [Planctomycetota bacterium]